MKIILRFNGKMQLLRRKNINSFLAINDIDYFVTILYYKES